MIYLASCPATTCFILFCESKTAMNANEIIVIIKIKYLMKNQKFMM